MLSADTFTQRLRGEIRQVLPERAFLRRDRGSALFVTNALSFEPEFAAPVGFHSEREGAMLHISPSEEQLLRFEREFACGIGPLSGSADVFKGKHPDREAMLLFNRGLKLLDAYDDAEWAAYDRAVRQYFAVTLRKKGEGGGLFALCLIDELSRM